MNTPQYRYEQQQKKKAAEAINVAFSGTLYSGQTISMEVTQQ